MSHRFSSSILAFIFALFLTACANTGTTTGEMEIRTGVIEKITSVELKSDHHTGVGAVVGGIAGLGVGSRIGQGTGRDVAMVLGAVGGAFAGHEVQNKYDKPVPGQEIIVRINNGVLMSVTQPQNPNLHLGQRVYIEGSGEGTRIVPR